MRVETLGTGAALRTTGRRDGMVVLCLNGGMARDVPGTWSASVEYLVRRLAPSTGGVGWAEVRYRVRSWTRLEMCLEDGRAALRALADGGAREVVLLGYSMGGAVSAAICDHPLVRRVVGLAPWLPAELDMSGMRGRRIDVLHGSLDRALPGVPGVSPVRSRAGFERLLALGATGTYALIPGALHAVALRAPWGALVPMPRARQWAQHVARILTTTEAALPAMAPGRP